MTRLDRSSFITKQQYHNGISKGKHLGIDYHPYDQYRNLEYRKALVLTLWRKQQNWRDKVWGAPKYFDEFLNKYYHTHLPTPIVKSFMRNQLIKSARLMNQKFIEHQDRIATYDVNYSDDRPIAPFTVTAKSVQPDLVDLYLQDLVDKKFTVINGTRISTVMYPKGVDITDKKVERSPWLSEPVDEKIIQKLRQYVKDLTTCGDIEPNPGPNGRNNNNKRGRRRPVRRRNRPRRNNNNTNTTALVRRDNQIHMNTIMPSRRICDMIYLDASPVRNAPGASFLVYAMRINDLYDPDPLILSGSLSNFKEMMAFYSYYRVLTTAIKWSVSNLETFPLACGIVFSQTNLTGTLPNLAACQNAFENDFVVPVRIISAKGGMDRTDFNLNGLQIARLLGVGSQYRSDIAYAGAGLSTPSIPLWANFIVYSPTGASMTNGYTNNTTLYMKSEFFGRVNNQA
jgi:hypothetical protein